MNVSLLRHLSLIFLCLLILIISDSTLGARWQFICHLTMTLWPLMMPTYVAFKWHWTVLFTELVLKYRLLFVLGKKSFDWPLTYTDTAIHESGVSRPYHDAVIRVPTDNTRRQTLRCRTRKLYSSALQQPSGHATSADCKILVETLGRALQQPIKITTAVHCTFIQT